MQLTPIDEELVDMDAAINQAQKKIEYISYNEDDYRQIILREQALLDYNSDMNASKREGIKEGIDKMIDAMKSVGVNSKQIEEALKKIGG